MNALLEKKCPALNQKQRTELIRTAMDLIGTSKEAETFDAIVKALYRHRVSTGSVRKGGNKKSGELWLEEVRKPRRRLFLRSVCFSDLSKRSFSVMTASGYRLCLIVVIVFLAAVQASGRFPWLPALMHRLGWSESR